MIYIKAKDKLLLKCLIDGHEWSATWGSLNTGYGCPVCSGNKVSDRNRFSIIHPELIKYFVNEEDAYNYSVKSSKRVTLKCPDCEFEKEMCLSNLCTDGFRCPICGDGFSIPNKFVANVLMDLKIDFIPEKSFEWLKKRRYDFYIPSLNMIIEVHGGQHYKQNTLSATARSFIEEQENDELKEQYAKNNNINKYIIIDARRSNIDFLISSTTLSLSDYFNFENISWYDLFEKCMHSNMIKVWEMYDNGVPMHIIIKSLLISQTTYYNYVRLGSKIGKCNYVPNSRERRNNSHKIKVKQYSLDNKFIAEFNSMSEASKITGVHGSSISQCCSGKARRAGDFKWKKI